MIPAYLYKYIYLILVAVLTLIFVGRRRDINQREPLVGSLILCVLLILFIGFRPHSPAFGDTINYSLWWGHITWKGSFDWHTSSKLFDNLYNYLGSVFPDATIFFVIIAIIYFSCMLVAVRKFFPANTLLVYLICLAAFSTFSYSTNGIKAGAAASLFLVALAYRDKIVVSVIFLLLSWGFHHSMHLPAVAYVLTLVFKDNSVYLYGWLFCLLMAALHISFFQELFIGLTDKDGIRYLDWNPNDDWGGKAGFRIDFVLYSAMPVLMGFFVKYKYYLKDKLYDIMLNMYLVCNGVWMLCMYAQFTNRIAYLSWFMYPILLVYPCYAIKDDSHPLVSNREIIVLLHLAFTLFMDFVFYS